MRCHNSNNKVFHMIPSDKPKMFLILFRLSRQVTPDGVGPTLTQNPISKLLNDNLALLFTLTMYYIQ